jgi:hypothetical protein
MAMAPGNGGVIEVARVSCSQRARDEMNDVALSPSPDRHRPQITVAR